MNINVLFTCVISVSFNKYVKKRNFVFILHQVNKHVVSRRWITESNVKHFNIQEGVYLLR